MLTGRGQLFPQQPRGDLAEHVSCKASGQDKEAASEAAFQTSLGRVQM